MKKHAYVENLGPRWYLAQVETSDRLRKAENLSYAGKTRQVCIHPSAKHPTRL